MPGRRKGRDDSDMGSEREETGSFETLRDEGMYFVHVKQWQKAVESFTRASDMNPEDNVVLVTRAKCHLQLGMADNALVDAEQALSNDKDYIMGLLMKAEALYQLGHFETALVFFHRGHKLRQERGEFRLGIQKAQEAINNSIGSPSSVKLDTTGDLSFFDKQDNWLKVSKKPPPKAYGKPGAKKASQKERDYTRSTDDSKTIKQLLEELYSDKTYLEKLLNDENLTSGRSYMQREIKSCINSGLYYLDERADFWRQQKPMYARKRDKEKMRRSGKTRPRDPVSYIMQNLEEIDEAQSEGRYETSLNTAKKLMKTVREMSEEDLSNKWEIMANIHSQMGNAYLEMGKYSLAIENHEQDLEIAEDKGLEDAKSRALDNIGRVYARRGHFEKAIEVWEKKLPLSKSPLEKTWLFHEIGRCYLESDKYDKAREYGEKSLAAAQEADDNGWQLHATVLVAQSEVKAKDNQSAQTSFEEALELAKILEDEAAMNAIQKALDEVKDKIAKDYRAGEDEDEGDEVDAKKVDYRPGEDDDDGRKSSQSKDSKKIRAAEDDDNEGRKSRGSSKAEYEDDFEEDKAGGAPVDPLTDDSQKTRSSNDTVLEVPKVEKQPEIRSHGNDKENSTDRCTNENEVVKFDSNSVVDVAVKNANGDATASGESPVLATGLGADVNSSGIGEHEKMEELAHQNNERKFEEANDDIYQKNKEDFTETDNSAGNKSTRQVEGDIEGYGNDDQIAHQGGTSAIQISDRIQGGENAGKEAEINDKDIDRETSPEECADMPAKKVIYNSGNNETGIENQTREVADFQANRKHSEDFQFKYINDTTGSRPSSKNSRASPPKSGNSHDRLVEDDPRLNYDIDVSNTTMVKGKKHPKGATNQQDTKKLQTRSKSSELAVGVRQRERVTKQKSLEETSRIRTPKSTVVTKEEKTTVKGKKDKVLPTKEYHVGKSEKFQIKDSDMSGGGDSAGNKSETIKTPDNTKGTIRKGAASSKGKIARKPRSADNPTNQQSISKDPRRKSDISPYGMPLTAGLQSKRQHNNCLYLKHRDHKQNRKKRKAATRYDRKLFHQIQITL
ncbi:tetratricopeptide repeat protein 25-like isoform X3 [Pecten maximus]|uniref:tetratricopeptide repeat protein 25-like isoform X3 n=1 Tax=Pecten maximus TaxID=6579 RepID=UPI001458C402|nr:tetratricopeptide repeat protein 25-like isoform X3 [Pecten maximus]